MKALSPSELTQGRVPESAWSRGPGWEESSSRPQGWSPAALGHPNGAQKCGDKVRAQGDLGHLCPVFKDSCGFPGVMFVLRP